ncbi:hypothetical protein D3C84_1159570 [compost metagenome]
MQGTIADRVHVTETGQALGIDRHAITAISTGVQQWLHGRNDADAGNHHLRRQYLTVCQTHSRHSTVLPF